MSRILALMTAFLICLTGSHMFAQEKKPPAETPAAGETEKPKTEVDQLLAKAKENGELVLVRCLQDCGENAIEGDVETGRALELPKPAYPKLARMAHVSGQVTVQLLIEKDGTVIAAAAVSGHPLLQGVSVDAAKNSRFSPTLVDGKPVKVTGVITYTFTSN
jgi:TonB family protein